MAGKMCRKKVRDDFCKYCKGCTGIFLQAFIADPNKKAVNELAYPGSPKVVEITNQLYRQRQLIDFVTAILQLEHTSIPIPEA